MLSKLIIKQFALIDELEVEFTQGLTIITGETGAGKSIIIGAIGLLTGHKAGAEMVADGAKKCVIEGFFKLSAQFDQSLFQRFEIDFDEVSILRREIYSDGKSRAFINDTPINIKNLKEITEQLIDVHSQNDHTALVDARFQLQSIDYFHQDIQSVNQFKKHFKNLRKAEKEYQFLLDEQAKSISEKDFLEFQLNEIEILKLIEGESESVEEEYKNLLHADEIKQNTEAALSVLENDEQGVIQSLKKAIAYINQTIKYNNQIAEMGERLQSAYLEIKDIAKELDNRFLNTENNQERQTYLENRLSEINKLLLKHRLSNSDELIDFTIKINQKLSEFSAFDDQIVALQKQIKSENDNLERLDEVLSNQRKKAIIPFAATIEKLLKRLGMPNAQFVVELNRLAQPNENGYDEISFKFSSNKGRKPELLSKVASGGEISRVMLALKYVLSSHQNLPTIIFDEIDTGISGAVAEEVGQVIRELSANIQVITITHLAQVAGKGNRHLKVYKAEKNNKTVTAVKSLTQPERVNEIASMISGKETSEAAKEQALELLK
jgi:DNA repair protein RecN (Recombination protein N)